MLPNVGMKPFANADVSGWQRSRKSGRSMPTCTFSTCIILKLSACHLHVMGKWVQHLTPASIYMHPTCYRLSR